MLTKNIDNPFYQSEAFYVTRVTVESSRNQYAAAQNPFKLLRSPINLEPIFFPTYRAKAQNLIGPKLIENYVYHMLLSALTGSSIGLLRTMIPRR
jgi:hypothetical protein